MLNLRKNILILSEKFVVINLNKTNINDVKATNLPHTRAPRGSKFGKSTKTLVLRLTL